MCRLSEACVGIGLTENCRHVLLKKIRLLTQSDQKPEPAFGVPTWDRAGVCFLSAQNVSPVSHSAYATNSLVATFGPVNIVTHPVRNSGT